MENEKEKLLENQYIRNDGKKYQVPRGMTVWILFILIEYTKKVDWAKSLHDQGLPHFLGGFSFVQHDKL